jgi:hypothetical protein
MEQKGNKFEKIKKSSSKISRKKIILIIAGVVILGTAVFFAQKYIRLYLKYMDFEDYQYYLSQRNEFYGEKNEIKDWSFGRYLQYLDEAKGAEKKAMEEQEKLLDVYRQDTVGGKTPEETLAGFVDALKKKDFDLASKYFWLDRKDEWTVKLPEMEKNNEIEKLILELEEIPKISETWGNESLRVYTYKKYFSERTVQLPDGRGGFITKLLPAGDYEKEIRFKLHPINDIWKIYSL